MKIYKNTVEVTKNSFNDEGDGIISFPHGLVISDSEIQRNGTRYDIDTLDITRYGGQLTANHEDKLQSIIGRVEGVKKNQGKVTVDRIVYAVKENPLARLAYDLLKGGFSKAFSTETMGISNTVDGTLSNHELVGLSQVVVPNNYSACINSLKKSLDQAKADGLDTSEIEKIILNGETNKMEETEKVETPEVEEAKVEETEVEETKVEEPAPEAEEVENSAKKKENAPEDKEDEDVEEIVKEDIEEDSEEEETESDEEEEETDDEAEKESKKKNEAEDLEEGEVETVDNEISDEEVKALFEKIDNLTKLVEGNSTPADEDVKLEKKIEEDYDNAAETEKTEINKEENSIMTNEEFKNAFAEALKNYFGEAKAPEFKKAENAAEEEASDYSKMDWKERYNKQINSAWEAFRLNSVDARKTLNDINKANLAALKEAGIAKNSMTIESMGNFVLPPEMYREIIGKRTDYSAIIDATDWRETDRLEFAFLRRNGDISMQNVVFCDDGEDGNLKPISEYTAEPVTEKLEELAAVTVVCNAATRFAAVDLLGDVAAGYRNDYDRKRAQLVIAKLEQAVNETGAEVSYDGSSDTGAMIAWLEAMAKISDTTTEGTLLFNNKTFAKLKAHALQAGVTGPLSEIFTTGEIPRIFGMKFIVLPNDLLPTIESDEVVEHTVGGEKVRINHAVFYGDLGEFVGYTSGGLQYDLSTDASYEVDGVVKSAYQRNELVLRGSFFRGGAIKDPSRIAGIKQEAES